MDLSLKERLIISNQLAILEKLDPENEKAYANHRKAIEQGYTLHYSDLTEWFYDELSEDQCREVLEILSMYSAITLSYRRAENKEGLAPDKIRFKGFDGNNEASQFGYARYFIIDLERYSELIEGLEYPDLNSHGMPPLSRYREMLKIWNNYSDKHSPTILQIKQLLQED